MPFFRLSFLFFCNLWPILGAQVVFKDTVVVTDPFYLWAQQQFEKRSFLSFLPLATDYLNPVPLRLLNPQEGVRLRLGETLLVPNRDFKLFLPQEELFLAVKEVYAIHPSFLEKSNFPLDHRVFVLFLPQLPFSRLQEDEFLLGILSNWRKGNRKENALLLLAYDFSLFENIDQDAFFSKNLSDNFGFSEPLGSDVLLLDQAVVKPLFEQRGLNIELLFRKFPIQKVNLSVVFDLQPLSKEKAYNIVAYLPASEKTEDFVVVSAYHDHALLGALAQDYPLERLPNALRYWFELAFGLRDFMQTKRKGVLPKLKKNVLFISFAGKDQGDYGLQAYLNYLKKEVFKPLLQIHLEDQLCQAHTGVLHLPLRFDLNPLAPYLNILQKDQAWVTSDEHCLQTPLLRQSFVPVVFYPIGTSVSFDEQLSKIIRMNLINLVTK